MAILAGNEFPDETQIKHFVQCAHQMILRNFAGKRKVVEHSFLVRFNSHHGCYPLTPSVTSLFTDDIKCLYSVSSATDSKLTPSPFVPHKTKARKRDETKIVSSACSCR